MPHQNITIRILVLSCLLLISNVLCRASTSDTFVVDFKKEKEVATIPFGVSTQFHFLPTTYKISTADSIVFADKDYDDTHWQSKEDVNQSGVENNPIKWYRFKLSVSEEYADYPMVMTIQNNGAYALFIDGVEYSQVGNFNDDNDLSKFKHLKKNPIYLTFDTPGIYQIAIKLQVENSVGKTQFLSVKLYDAKKHFKESKVSDTMMSFGFLGLGTTFFTLFMLHLLLFIFYRADKSNLIFAIFSLTIAITLYALLLYDIKMDLTYEDLYTSIFNGVPIISCFSLLGFVVYIFGEGKNRMKLVYILCIICFVFVLTYFFIDAVIYKYVIWTLLGIGLAYTIGMIIVAIYKRKPGSLILGSGVLLFLSVLIVFIILSIVNGGVTLNNAWILFLVFAIFSIPLSISAYLAWRFSTTNRNLIKQLVMIEQLSEENQQILLSQNEILEQQVSSRTQELQMEKQKSDDLLLNILPQEIADELKEQGKTQAQYYDEVSVIFTDFVNFTMHSERIGAEAMVTELNEHFTAFDMIMERHGLEKIKTIGDAYLAVCGLPITRVDHALRTVAAAMDIIDYISKCKESNNDSLDIRIGIHSGPLVAGIVGVKKFAYDIWGDTVNTAARMEQNSEPGKINVSKDTYELIKQIYQCTQRDPILVKGKGEMEMYFVNRKINI